MEQPEHDLRAHLGGGAKATPERFVSFMIVGLLHVGIAIALVLGLKQGFIQKQLQDIKVAVEKEKVPDKTPPPPPPILKEPPPPFVPPPEFVVSTEPPPNTTAINVQSKVQTPPAIQPTELHAITRTHTLPPYPSMALRLNQQGTTMLRVTISTSGDVTDAVIEKSSGFDVLDQAAMSFVKSHWRWQPPTRGGQPVAAVTLVAVKWDVKNAQ